MKARIQRGDSRQSRPRRKRKLEMSLFKQMSDVLRPLGILIVLAIGQSVCAPRVAVVLADAPAQAETPTIPVETPTAPIETPTPPGSDGDPAGARATPLPPARPTSASAGPDIEEQATVTPTQTAVAETSTPTPTPTPTAVPPTSTPTPPSPGTSHLAIQVSESVVSVGGTASSEVFVYLKDVQPGISGYHLSLRFDPQIVRIVDADGNAANGTQVAPSDFFVSLQAGRQRIAENRVDNGAGEMSLTVMQEGTAPVHGTQSWHKVATLTWAGQREGNSVVSVGSDSHFIGPDGRTFAPDAANNGTVYARLPGQVRGRVVLQGRTGSGSAQVTSSLAAARADTVNADPDGRFALTTSHGEGFYTLVASAPGYLSAAGHRPVKLTVGSAIDLGEVTLYGGDANGDNRIDIRDLSYVAWHLDTDDARADINGDGQVDILDLSLIAGNFGRVGPTVWQLPAT
jgi:hypothetical protein